MYSEKKCWSTEASSTVNHLLMHADFRNLLAGNFIPVSYYGYILKPYEKRLPLEEEHDLYTQIRGKHLSVGLKGVFTISAIDNVNNDAQSNFYPGKYGENENYYAKSYTTYDNFKKCGYGGVANLGFSHNRFALTIMTGGQQIRKWGYSVEMDRKPEYHKTDINIMDYNIKNDSYEIKAGLKMSIILSLLNQKYACFAGASSLIGQCNEPVRYQPYVQEKSAQEKLYLTFSGVHYTEKVTEIQVGLHETNIPDQNGNLFYSRYQYPYCSFSLIQLNAKRISEKKKLIHQSSYNAELSDSTTRYNNLEIISGSVIPEIELSKFVSFKLPISVLLNNFPISQRFNGAFAGTINLQFPLKDIFLFRATLSSGELSFDYHVDQQKLSPQIIYRAYSALFSLQIIKSI
jgi:hypothetical protein